MVFGKHILNNKAFTAKHFDRVSIKAERDGCGSHDQSSHVNLPEACHVESAHCDQDEWQVLKSCLKHFEHLHALEALFGVEEIIDPRETRPLLCRFVDAMQARLATELGPKPKFGVRP